MKIVLKNINNLFNGNKSWFATICGVQIVLHIWHWMQHFWMHLVCCGDENEKWAKRLCKICIINLHVYVCYGRLDWIGLDLFNDDTRPTEPISRLTQVGSLTVYNLWQFISDRRIRLLVKIPLCKSRESSQRGSSKSQQCSIHPEFPAEVHIPRACGQWSTSVHNDGK